MTKKFVCEGELVDTPERKTDPLVKKSTGDITLDTVLLSRLELGIGTQKLELVAHSSACMNGL